MSGARHTTRAEQALVFACGADHLLGIVHPAADAASDVGVLVVVGGPQYRVGSHRQFVQLGRALAAAGHATLRFDVRGMGDSSGDLRSFEQLDDDIAAAIDALLRAAPLVRRVVLWGLCDAASAALLYLRRRGDARVRGLVLLNPWVRTTGTQAITTVKHYYRQRLMQKSFWSKLLSGGVALQALGGLLGQVRAARRASVAVDDGDYVQQMAQGWERFDGPALLVLSGQDFTAREFLERCGHDARWQRLIARAGITRVDIPNADHTFSTPGSLQALNDATLQWLAYAYARP